MQINITRSPIQSLVTECLLVTHLENHETLQALAKEVDNALQLRISQLLKEKEIKGKFGEVTFIHTWGLIPAKKILVLGLGEEKKLTLDRIRDAIAIAARKARETSIKQLNIGVTTRFKNRWNPVDLVQSVVEGVHLGLYQFDGYKSALKEKIQIEEVTLSLHDLPVKAMEVGIERGEIFSAATNLARDLVNAPANKMTPTTLAAKAEEVAKRRNLEFNTLEKSDMVTLGMGALLGVSSASAEPPKMIVMKYMGAPDSQEILALVGKGITFDSGGYQVKPDTGMVFMKTDMAGAAAVIGAMDAIGALQPHANVIAVIPACENMISGEGMRPGDVLKAFNEKTIEVKHTDAEGRLVLADAVAYALHLGATKMVDVATLTGAIIVALGNTTTGLMSNDSAWSEEVKTAAHVAGEKVWELPMYEEYEEYLQSEIADMKNHAGRPAGAIQGALFIREFVGDVAWAHLDIAGTAMASKEHGANPIGATGVAVRSLTQLAIRFGGK